MYDYLIVGSGLSGSVFAQRATELGKKVLVIEKRNHIGGNCYTENIEGIQVHKYGPHIFHTNAEYIWKYINRFTKFNNFIYQPKAYYRGNLYSLPFNLNTFYEFYGTVTPEEAQKKLEEKKREYNKSNLEDWALFQVGPDIYYTLIYGYTKKQWGVEPRELPASIIRRLPVRFTFNNNYFNDTYQGIPENGYTEMFHRLLDGIEVKLNCEFQQDWRKYAKRLYYTGPIDEFYNFRFGSLGYRSLRFESEILEGDYQGLAVVNYTDYNIPYTRIIEHKHFSFLNSKKTVITREYPSDSGEKYYPINNFANNNVYNQYMGLKTDDVIFCGRLANYKYWNMDQAIAAALKVKI